SNSTHRFLMPDIALDLRFLHYAVLAARLGSFRAAAESLNLSQSTVSRRIRVLERRLGIELFERDPPVAHEPRARAGAAGRRSAPSGSGSRSSRSPGTGWQ